MQVPSLITTEQVEDVAFGRVLFTKPSMAVDPGSGNLAAGLCDVCHAMPCHFMKCECAAAQYERATLLQDPCCVESAMPVPGA